MLWNLQPVWLALAVSTVTIFSFVIGLAVDGLMKEDGFGTIGNTAVLAAGFFAAIVIANSEGIVFDSLRTASGAGLGGSMSALVALALAKAGLARL